MKTLVDNIFNNIRAVITNNGMNTNLDLINKKEKMIYRETLRRDDNWKENLDDDMMSKSIYIFFQIWYTKTKTYRRYIYIY